MTVRAFVSQRRAAAIVAASPAAAWWLERLIRMPSAGWFSADGVFPIGGDLRTLYSAAYLVVHRAGDVVYNAERFRHIYAASLGEYGPFANPPPLLVLIAPLGWLSFETAWWVLAGLSVAGIVAGLSLMGVRRFAAGAVAALMFPPVYFTITFGQVSVLWLVVFAGVYRLLRADRPVAAGAVAGLMIMKPTLALGLAVWWLLDWRRYRVVVVSALAAAAAYLAASYAILPSVWAHYARSAEELLTDPGNPLRQWAQFSLWSAWRITFPTLPTLALVVGMVSLGIGIFVLVPLLRRASDIDASFALAIIVTVLLTPYVIAYDWLLLLLAGAVLWRRARSTRLEIGMSLVVLVSGFSTVLSIAMIDRFGFAVQIAPLALLAAAWVYREDLVTLS
ncbi:MAG: glycosyltransferase family 87 protein [Acidimicrobiia bacterium]